MVTQTIDIDRLVEARERGARYLVARQGEDGVIGDPSEGLGSYYKAPWALAASGRTAEGSRLLAWIRRHMLSPEGDLAGDFEREKHLASVHPYPNAWVVCGAQKLGRFDIAKRGMDFISTLQDSESGGFRSRLDRPDGDQDIMSASQAGMAALYTGRLEVAHGVGRFLQHVWEDQPDPEHALYVRFRPGSGLITEFEPKRARRLVVRADERYQAYFMIGIVPAFLTKLALATGEHAQLDLAGRYLELAFHCTEEMYTTAQVGKVGWGAALLAGASGEERYRSLANRVGDALLTQQTEDGSWNNTGGFTTQAVADEVTAEFVAILDEMVQGLSSA